MVLVASKEKKKKKNRKELKKIFVNVLDDKALLEPLQREGR